jgi:hypothetical protein
MRSGSGNEGVTLYWNEFLITYPVHNQEEPMKVWAEYTIYQRAYYYREAHRIANSFRIGENHICWYDPNNPEKVSLKLGFDFVPWIDLVVSVGFLLAPVAVFCLRTQLAKWSDPCDGE